MQTILVRADKSCTLAYLFWLFFGIHYLYLRRPGLQLLYWFTLGGFGIWMFIDLFRIPIMVDAFNNQVIQVPDQVIERQPASTATTILSLSVLLIGIIIIGEKLTSKPPQAAPTPAPVIAAATQSTIGNRQSTIPRATPWKPQGTALDQKKRQPYIYQAAPKNTAPGTGVKPSTTWTQTPDGRWIEHNSAVSAQGSRGL